MQAADNIIDAKKLKQLFQKSADVQFHVYTFNQRKVMFITCEAMIDQHLLNDVVVERVQLFFNALEELSFEEAVTSHLHIPALKEVQAESEIITSVYSGNVLLYFEDYNVIYSSNISKKPNRNPEETKTEVLVKGPRDNFIEDIFTNIALIRKRMPTNSLCVEKFEVGKRTKTTVAVLYFDDIVDQEILSGIKEKINNIDVDIIFSGDILMEHIDKRWTVFPRHDYTGRPDFALQYLARGRFVILIDGVAYGVIIPVNFFLLFKTGEDHENSMVFSSVERLLRLVGFLLGTLLPAFWLALTTFHQNQLPLLLLATVVQTRTGLPLPTSLEMILMIFMFELFREFGLRLPAAIGGTISVVGGLIIGDAAIRAGITSPAMIVIIATSVIASYTLVNQTLVSAVSILRFFFLFLTSFLGLFGFLLSFFLIVLYLANMRTFGVPYLAITADLSWSNILRTIIRPSEKYYAERPHDLNPKDKTRLKNGKK
ncbi:spore germination protein [Psychrobacillus soli]|uniref:Spore germination protein n=1 Tax=Psychrobacillus soli TaxID=1543965 RepID=A0A544TM29_9BACI|nr:spore germination protein [Psychrobacillus soli]TQR18503.1 spore germination protein [Psychrobacillus soli]